MALKTEEYILTVSGRVMDLTNAVKSAESYIKDITEFLGTESYELGSEKDILFNNLISKRLELEKSVEINKTKIINLLDFYPDPDMILIRYTIKIRNTNK